MLHRVHIPIITENKSRLAKFKGHVLNVHFQKPAAAYPAGEQKLLIVAEYLPKLCTVFKMVHATIPSPANHVYHDNDDPPRAYKNLNLLKTNAASTKPSVKLSTRDHKFVQLDSDSIKALLKPFRTVVFGMQIVEFVNLSEELTGYAQDLERVMAPRSVWLNAAAWHYLETVREMKRQGDSLVTSGDLAGAVNLYQPVWMQSNICPILNLPKDSYTPEVAAIVAQIDLVVVTCAVMDDLICISQGNIDRKAAMIRDEVNRGRVSHALSDLGQEDCLAPNLCHIITWSSAVTSFLLDDPRERLPEGPAMLSVFVQGGNADNLPIKNYFVHDVAAMMDIVKKVSAT